MRTSSKNHSVALNEYSSTMTIPPPPPPIVGITVAPPPPPPPPPPPTVVADELVRNTHRTIPISPSPSQSQYIHQKPSIRTRLWNFFQVQSNRGDHTNYTGTTNTSIQPMNGSSTMDSSSRDNYNNSYSNSNSKNNSNSSSNNVHHHHHHLDPNILMGLNIAGVASTIIHTMMGIQTEQHLLSNIARKIQVQQQQQQQRNNNNNLDHLRNLVTDIINSTSEIDDMNSSSNSNNQIMIRTTNSPKLQYDLLIRMIGTGIILYYSVHALPFQNHPSSKMGVGRRLDVIGILGFMFVFIFLLVRYVPILLPFYEWMRILLIVNVASPVINDTFMYDTARIQFIMSSQIINFIATLLVRYVYESVTSHDAEEEDVSTSPPWLSKQHLITNIFALISALLFASAQHTINGKSVRETLINVLRQPPRIKVHTEDDDNNVDDDDAIESPINGIPLRTHSNTPSQPRSIPWYRIIRDMWYSNNIQRWIIMQTLLEIQMSILYLLFLYTILYEMDHNVRNTRFLWTLFRLRKVDTILVHIPMFLFGYTGVYNTLFATVFGLSLYTYGTTHHPSNAMTTIHVLTIIYYISCMAVHSAGFNVAMADLTMSLRYYYAKTSTTTDNHHNYHHHNHHHHHHRGSDREPNIAGIVIAYNSFICKPITYCISGIVASILRNGRSNNTLSSTAFYVLIYTTIVSSAIQLYVWKRYELVKHRTTTMRDELSLMMPK